MTFPVQYITNTHVRDRILRQAVRHRDAPVRARADAAPAPRADAGVPAADGRHLEGELGVGVGALELLVRLLLLLHLLFEIFLSLRPTATAAAAARR